MSTRDLSLKARALLAAASELKDACVTSIAKDPTKIIADRIRNVFASEFRNLLGSLSALPGRERDFVSKKLGKIVTDFDEFLVSIESKLMGEDPETLFLENSSGAVDPISTVTIGSAKRETVTFSILEFNPNSDGLDRWLNISVDGPHRRSNLDVAITPSDLRKLAKMCNLAAANIEEKAH